MNDEHMAINPGRGWRICFHGEMMLIADHQPLTIVSWYHDKPWQGLDLFLFVFMALCCFGHIFMRMECMYFHVLLYEWCEDVDFAATLNHGKITSNTGAPMVSVHGMLRDTMVWWRHFFVLSLVIDRCRDWICFYLHSWCFVVNLTHVLSGVVVLLCFADFSCQERSRI